MDENRVIPLLTSEESHPRKLPSSLAHTHGGRAFLYVLCTTYPDSRMMRQNAQAVLGVYLVTGQHRHQFPASQCKSSHIERKPVGLERQEPLWPLLKPSPLTATCPVRLQPWCSHWGPNPRDCRQGLMAQESCSHPEFK